MPLPKGEDQATRLVQEFNQSNQGVFVQLKDTFTGNDFMSAPQAAAQADCFASPLPPALTRHLASAIGTLPSSWGSARETLVSGSAVQYTAERIVRRGTTGRDHACRS